jgi:membrane protease YdiL (CAAX protease family)
MSPEVPTPDTLPPEIPQRESYPFWNYLDLAAFVLVALMALTVEALLAGAARATLHVKQVFVLLPAQFLLYGVLLGALALMFRRYYGRPFWKSLRWVPSGMPWSFVATCGIVLAVAVMVVSLLLRTPDINSPMKDLLADKSSVLLVGVFGITLGPLCEEMLFRGFLQPLLVRSLGAVHGVLLTAVPFGLLHLQEYAYSWRHVLLITAAGAGFGWMRERTGSTKAAAIMHASYNSVFFLLLAVQQAAPHAR